MRNPFRRDKANDPGSVDYEGAWDTHAKRFKPSGDYQHIGDQWTGVRAGAANSNEESVAVIRDRVLAPNVNAGETVLEIGVGGGRTGAMILDLGATLMEADVAQSMLDATRERLGDEKVTYHKLDGATLDAVPDGSADVCVIFDTLVHVEPRDTFNYLTRIPAKLKARGRRRCVFHHSNTTSELGFQRFLLDWQQNLNGRRGDTFSVMTPELMHRFLTHLGYTDLVRDDDTIPRDTLWTATAPASVDPALLGPSHPLYTSNPKFNS